MSVVRISALLLVATGPIGFAAPAEGFAVFKSVDRGRSWVRSDVGMPARSRINAFGSAGGVLLTGTDAGIFTSRNEAGRWDPASGVAMSTGRILSFATLGRKVVAGTDGNGMLMSPDGGQSWVMNRNSPSPKVRCLVTRGGKLYAGTDADGVFESHDAGQTWTRLSAGLPADGQIFSLSIVEGRLFAGLYSLGLYRWEEKQDLWAKIGQLTPLALASVHGTLIAGHNPGGLYWSGDLGVSWSKGAAAANALSPSTSAPAENSGELSAEGPVWELASGDGLVFAGASGGIYYSEDDGRTWARARAGLPEESPGVAFLVKREVVLVGIPVKASNGKSGRPKN